MIFPIGDDKLTGIHKPIVSYTLIALNVLFFIAQSLAPNQLIPELAAVPSEILAGEKLHTLFTSMFMHGGFMHILGNMLFLWIFGDNIESVIGSIKFALFYIAGGLFATFAHILLDPSSYTPMVGASGAIAAVMGAYIIMFPKSQIKLLFLLNMSTFKIGAVYFLGFWIAQQVLSGIGALGMLGQNQGGVAYWAHIGGFIAGVGIGFLFKKINNKVQHELEFEEQEPVWTRYVT